MRAIEIKQFGGPEVLELAELPVPRPGPGEVLIRVTRAGVNFADTHRRSDDYVAASTLPLVPGAEVAGVRESDGARVVALTGTGGYAQWAVAPARDTFPIPDGLDDATALALLLQGLTAWHCLRTCAHLAAGETVVVHSAAGGVGSLATQLARPLGAGLVIATASSERRRALALELGADVALDGAGPGLRERLQQAAGDRAIDVVLEASGGEVFSESLAALAPMGRIVVYGISSREQREIRTGSLLRHSRAVIGFWLMHLLERPELVRPVVEELFARAASGELRAIVGGTYPLSQAAQAQTDLVSRRTSGKLVLDPAG